MRNCAAKACQTKVVDARSFCAKHWTMVPSTIQFRLAEEWKPTVRSMTFNSMLNEAILAVKQAENVQL